MPPIVPMLLAHTDDLLTLNAASRHAHRENVRAFVLGRATHAGLSDALQATFASHFDEVFDDLWEELDADGDGQVEFNELYQLLRAGKRVRLRAPLREGARGPIETLAQNAIELRRDVWERRVPPSELREATVAEVRVPPPTAPCSPRGTRSRQAALCTAISDWMFVWMSAPLLSQTHPQTTYLSLCPASVLHPHAAAACAYDGRG